MFQKKRTQEEAFRMRQMAGRCGAKCFSSTPAAVIRRCYGSDVDSFLKNNTL